MFRRFSSKFNAHIFHRATKRQNAELVFRSILHKRRLVTLSSIALTSFCGLNLWYLTYPVHNSFFSPSNLESMEEIQARCSQVGSPEQEMKTIDFLKQQLEGYSKEKGEKSPEVATILMLLASHCIISGNQADGIKYGERSCDIFLEIDQDKDLFLDQLDDIAATAQMLSLDEAIRLNQKSLEHKKKVKGENHQGCVLNYLALGELYMIQEQKEKANANFDNAKNLLNSSSIQDKKSSNIYYEACEAFHAVGRLEDSKNFCNRALEYLRKNQKQGSGLLAKEARIIDVQSSNALGLGSPTESIDYLKQLDDYYEKSIPERKDPYYFTKGQTLVRIGNIYYDQKDYKEALRTFKDAASAFKNISENGDVLVYISLRTISDVYGALNDKRKAYSSLQEAYELARKAFGDNHPNTRNDLSALQEMEKQNL